jgi:ABC-type branched-subunit amino acid transport system ATPase component
MVEQNFAKAMEIADRACVIVKGKIVFDSVLHKQLDRELLRQYYLGEKK